MRIKTSRTAPDPLASKEYAFPAFASGKPFPEKKTGRLPAMGWNSWNAFGSGNTEALTKVMADKIIELGLDQLGYEYLVLDDGCYCSERNGDHLVNEPVKFPSGFKALADYIHGKGLKFGMYNDIGTNLCAGAAVGTCGFEDIDAQNYVDWDVDFLKVDNCYYLWDNATFSNGENARFTYAPRIQSIRLVALDSKKEMVLDAVKDGVLAGKGGKKEEAFVSFIGTFDGTNTGTSPVGDMSSELVFTVNAENAGEYKLYVTYASAKEVGCGEWLQVAVGEVSAENRFFDALLPETKDKDTFTESEAIKITLEKGENVLRLMNHRRQENTLNSYAAMFYALKEAKPDNDILLSICEWGKTQPHNWGYKIGDSWRILNDITFMVGSDGDPGRGSWNDPGTQSIASQYNKCVVMDEFSGLTLGYNDPDMMVVGMNDITTTMAQTHMEMWCMMNSPLMLGMDLRRVEKGDEIYNIIANKDLIDLNQDALGIQAKRIYSTLKLANPDKDYTTDNNRVDVLVKPLANGDFAISFFNLSEEKKGKVSVDTDLILSMVGHKMVNAEKIASAGEFTVKNLVTKEEYKVMGKEFSVEELEAYGSRTVRVSVV